jgi:PhzF family phenazine biosynthesis protein
VTDHGPINQHFVHYNACANLSWVRTKRIAAIRQSASLAGITLYAIAFRPDDAYLHEASAFSTSAAARALFAHRHIQEVILEVIRVSAFSENGAGGNPAGVLIADKFPDAAEMQRIASEVGYSETAFAVREGMAWRVRYFSPESEVPFCGHATIALGAVLALQEGPGVFALALNNARITVEGQRKGDVLVASLQSPPTRSARPSGELVGEVLDLFGYSPVDLNPDIPPALAHGGADHFVLALNSRAALSAMTYDLDSGRTLMLREGLVTILLAYAETPRLFHTRNPFASGGVYEDPATGAATAAFAGYLRDITWPHEGEIEVIQGEDMGMRSRLRATIPPAAGSSIRVSGEARLMT